MNVIQSYNSDATRIIVDLGKHGLQVTVICNKETRVPESIEVRNSYNYKQSVKLQWLEPTP